MAPLEAVLIGAGERGTFGVGAFALAHPQDLKFTAVAEPDAARRERFAAWHGIPPERCFATGTELLAQGRLAPLCFIETLDRDHVEPGTRAMELGYDVFLEKPMAESPEKVLQLQATAEATGRILQICHPLRYTPFYMRVKELLGQGRIGAIRSLSMTESVGYWHYSHSYVRGNWRRQDESGPLILTKCCHDMDIAAWLADDEVESVVSLGGRIHFREENAPAGAPARCLDGCPAEETCAFFAPRMYLGARTGWPVSVISTDSSLEARRRALEQGPYGRCVYHCDNDVADHQSVSARFRGGAVLDFTVRANSHDCYRTIRIAGSEGELAGHLERNEITVRRFTAGIPEEEYRVEVHRPFIEAGGHSGGDTGVARHFVDLVRRGDRASAARSLAIAVEGHLLAFAAEEARATGSAMDMTTFRSNATKASGV
ncbi:MAG: hypothetical protein PWP23_1524 [Candidatus Sumerlaeota bacterium]|nr:hypothetical protein [Candidatus Sumerlaeota bacterium]